MVEKDLPSAQAAEKQGDVNLSPRSLPTVLSDDDACIGPKVSPSIFGKVLGRVYYYVMVYADTSGTVLHKRFGRRFRMSKLEGA